MSVYNREDILARTLTNLARQDVSPERFRVLVADGGSHDSSPEIAARFAESHPDLFRCTRSHTRSSLAATRNLGWRTADSPLILYLDSDLVACPSLVSAHLAAHAEHPDERIGVLGHVAYPAGESRTPLRAFGNMVVRMWSNAENLVGRSLDWRYFLGGNISLKRSLLVESGGFNEAWFGNCDGYEDWEMGLRLFEQRDFEIRYAPGAVAYHYHWREPMAVLNNMRLYGTSMARWLAQRPDLETTLLWETPSLAFLREDPPLRERVRRTLINARTAPMMLNAAGWLKTRWEWGSALLYRKCSRHFVLSGYRDVVRTSNMAAGSRKSE